jgi:hypothetical protein
LADEAQSPLKIVVVVPADRALLDAARSELLACIGVGELRELDGGALLAHTDASVSHVRDRVGAVLPDGASVFVAAFEQWSARGHSIDRVWLGRRGH